MTRGDTLRAGYHDLVRGEILELIPSGVKTVLDLGCGTGALGKALKQRQLCTVHGIELSKDAAKIAEKNLDVVFCNNLNRFDPVFLKQKYDTLVFADILEHLISPWRILRKFMSVLADDGTVIASLPNVAHPHVIANLKKGLFRYEPAGILDITHLRFFTKTSIFQLFYMAGLKVVSIRAYPSDKNPIQYHVTAVKIPEVVKEQTALILILTYNGWGYTKKCIDSIKKHTHAPYKLLVIDNGSTDETVEQLRADRTLYHIENECNLGFAAGFNVGLMLVDTKYFVLVNSDTVVTDNWLSTMVYHINEDKDLMVLGPRSNHVSGPQLVSKVPYSDDQSLDKYALEFRKDVAEPLTYFPRIVFFFTLFKAEVLSKAGYLDEIYSQGNYEDDDYCMKVAHKKLKAAFCNTVFIHHYGSRAFTGNKIDFKKSMEVNGQLFMKKWGFKNMQEYFLYLKKEA